MRRSCPSNNNHDTATADLSCGNLLSAARTRHSLAYLSAFMKVTCQTEDGVRVDAIGHLTLEITRPNGTPVSTSIYRKPTQNREGVVTFQSIANRCLEEAGQWSIICQYNEYRERLKSVLPAADHVTRSHPVQFVVHPGKVLHLK